MKKINIFWMTLFIMISISGYCKDQGEVKKDTITINFGNQSKIIIYVSDKSDFKILQNYDLNKMLEDLSISIDTLENDVKILKIEDVTGTKYLEDTTIVVNDGFEEFTASLEGYTKEFIVSNFNRIEAGNTFEVHVRPGEDHKIVLNGKEEDVDDVHVEINDNELQLKFGNALKIDRSKVRAFISTPVLEKVELSGATKGTIKGFKAENFSAELDGAAKTEILVIAENIRVEQSGATKLKLSGKANYLGAELSGASKLDADELQVIDADIETSGAAKASVNALNLNKEVSGAGAVRNQEISEEERDEYEEINVRIGNMKFSAEVDDWEDIEEDFEDIEDFEDFKSRFDKEEFIDKEVPDVKHSFNIDLGMNNYLQNGKFPEETGAPYAVKPWGSWYVAFNSNHKFHITGPLFIEWGKGISWYNFKFDNEDIRINAENDTLMFIEDSRNVNAIKSKLTASYINMSLIPVIDFSRGFKQVKSYSYESFRFTKYKKQGFRIGAGPYFGYRIGSHSKFVYKDDGREKEKDRDNFMLDNWRYGIRVQAGYKALDIFFNYDLNDLFLGKANPSLNAFSFGITL